jgi:hypothetical protein
MRRAALLTITLLTACSTAGGPYPSLQLRAPEAIDPRVPIDRPMNDRPVTPALAAELRGLVDQAHRAEGAFESAASQAERLAAAARGPQSDGWVAAQEALSAAVAARRPVSEALSEIDALGADKLQSQGGLAPSDLAAIQAAGAEVGAIDRRQAERLKAIQRRLGA